MPIVMGIERLFLLLVFLDFARHFMGRPLKSNNPTFSAFFQKRRGIYCQTFSRFVSGINELLIDIFRLFALRLR